MGDDDVYDLRWFLVLKGLIPTSLLLQLEAGRNFETFIASTSGLKPFSSTDQNMVRVQKCMPFYWPKISVFGQKI